MTSVRRSLAIVVVENLLILALQLVMSVIVARLLTPEEIGVYSIAVITLAVARVLRDFGVEDYLIKETELTAQKLRATSAISFSVSWALAVLVCLAAVPMASFYEEPRLRTLTWVLAANFVIIPFGAVSMAVLRREFQMGKIFMIRVSSAFASATTSVVLAALGFGPMSLAIGNAVNTGVTVVGARLLRSAGLPLWPSLHGVRRILSFSGNRLTSNLLIEASRAAPDAILGKTAGPAAVALFGRAAGLVDVFARFMGQVMWSVTLPYFSKVKRDGEQFGAALTQALSYLIGVAWAFYAVLGLAAHPITVVLFGDQWVASIPVLHWLSAFGAATVATTFASTALIGADHAAREVRMTAKVRVLRVVMVAAAARFGIVTLAMCLSAAAIVEMGIVTMEVRRTLGIQYKTIVSVFARSAALAAWSSLPALVLVVGDRMKALHLVGLLVFAVASLAFWLIGVFLLRHPLRNEIGDAAARITFFLRSR